MLQNDLGVSITGNENILKEITGYYKKLFKSQNLSSTVLEEYLGEVIFPCVTIPDKNMLDSPIGLEEIRIAMNNMANNKCPGLDGLPIEFYKKFWNVIKYTLHSLFIKVTETSILNKTARQGVVSLLPKPNKDLQKIQNWRPLTMLCCDYKLYTKTIANRLQCVLGYIISEDQKGFMKGRSISENILELQSIIDYCNNENKAAYVITLDLEKAYDRSEFVILYDIMRRFGFGETFIDYVKVCEQGFSNSILNNGVRSDFFYPSRGYKQGCPIAPYQFLLLIEAFSLKIKQND